MSLFPFVIGCGGVDVELRMLQAVAPLTYHLVCGLNSIQLHLRNLRSGMDLTGVIAASKFVFFIQYFFITGSHLPICRFFALFASLHRLMKSF